MSRFGSFLKILERVGPAILEANPTTRPLAGVVTHAIGQAHLLGGSDTQKKKHAMGIVEDAIAIANAAKLRGFEDPQLVAETASHGIDTVVGAVKIVEGTKVAASIVVTP